METKQNIYEKLQQCRVELQQKGLKKGGKNKFANFEYFELGDFIPTVNQLFLEHRLHSVFNIEEVTNANTGVVSGVATLKIINIDNPNEVEIFTSPTAEANLKGCTPIQSLGGVHTYMKRYLYLNALEIVEPDLLDGAVGNTELGNSPKPQNKGKKQGNSAISNANPINNNPVEQMPNYVDYANETQLTIIYSLEDKYKTFALQKYKIARLEDLTYDQANHIINELSKKGIIQNENNQ